MFFCAISGEPPQDPVVSSKSGHVYERRLITKYIQENGTDPVTGEKLEEGDLVTVKASPNATAPRPPTHSSIPALLNALQNEWDALVLESFALKQQFHATRQELSYALYSQDAASRVVARVMRERDAAREALASVQASMGLQPSVPGGGDVEMEDEPTKSSDEPFSPAVLERINETFTALSATRKKRKAPADHAKPADVSSFTSTGVVPSLHSASPAGVTSIALSAETPGTFLSGGNDGIVQLYDKDSDKVLSSQKAHAKRVTRVALREALGSSEPTLLLSAGADKLARIYSLDAASNEYAPRGTLRTHSGEVTGLALHPTRTLLALSSLDGTYSVADLTTMQSLFRSAPAEDGEKYSGLAVHPDGTLLTLGTTTGAIRVFDFRSGSLAASLSSPTHASGTPFAVPALSFAENGYSLAASSGPHELGIWDLRKQNLAHTWDLGEGVKVNDVKYDFGAQLIGAATSAGVRAWAHKSWDELGRWEEGGEAVAVAWGAKSQSLWGVTGRDVRIWGKAA